jgi:DNA-binding CsgD family transcriptional regulator
MATTALNTRKGLPANPAVPTLAELIRSLVRQANAPEIHGPSKRQDGDPHNEEVIFDVDLDGARYLLIRLPKPNRPRVQLSPREQEIVRMVAQGHSNKIIADVLSISSWTVCTHLRRIFAKLGVGSRAAMVAQMLETSRLARRAAPAGGGDTYSRNSTACGLPELSAEIGYELRSELATQKTR